MLASVRSAWPAPPAPATTVISDSVAVTASLGSVNRLSPFDAESKSRSAWCATVDLWSARPPRWFLVLLAPGARAAPERLTAATLATVRGGVRTVEGRPAPPRPTAGSPLAHDEAGRPLFRIRLDPVPHAGLDPAGRHRAAGFVWFDPALVTAGEYQVVVYDSTGMRRNMARLEVKP